MFSNSPRLWRSDFQRQLGACGPCVGLHVSPADSPRHRLLQRSLPVKNRPHFSTVCSIIMNIDSTWYITYITWFKLKFNRSIHVQPGQPGGSAVDAPLMLLLVRQWHRVVRIGSEPWRFFGSAKPCASDLKLCLGEQCKTHILGIIYASYMLCESMWQHCDTAIPAAIPTDPADFVLFCAGWMGFVRWPTTPSSVAAGSTGPCPSISSRRWKRHRCTVSIPDQKMGISQLMADLGRLFHDFSLSSPTIRNYPMLRMVRMVRREIISIQKAKEL